MENKAVAVAAADVIVVVTVTAIRNETGTLQIDRLLKVPHGVALPPTLEVPDIPEDSISRPCRGSAAQVGYRYIALLRNPPAPGGSYGLIAEDGGLPVWNATDERLLAELIADPHAGDASRPDQSYSPSNGFVPDAATAARIAEAVWIPIYGPVRIEAEKPFKVSLRDDVWTVTGKDLPPSTVGGVAEAEISKIDGRILRVIHGQ